MSTDLLSITLSIIALLVSCRTFNKDNKINLAMHFEPSYYDKELKNTFVMIQSYNKSKIGEAFRFNGVFFSQDKLNYTLKKEKQENLLDDISLETDINPKDFEVIKPFDLGEVRKIDYNIFVDKSAFLIQNDNKLKEVFLNNKKTVYVVIIYEESLGKKNVFKAKLNSKKDGNSCLYNDISQKLKIKDEEISTDV